MAVPADVGRRHPHTSARELPGGRPRDLPSGPVVAYADLPLGPGVPTDVGVVAPAGERPRSAVDSAESRSSPRTAAR